MSATAKKRSRDLRLFRQRFFRRSQKGNAWCRIGQYTLTVFPDSKGTSFRWCIAQPDKTPKFSANNHPTERAAMKSLYRALDEMGAFDALDD